MSADILKSIQQGERDAKAKARAKKRGERLARGASGTSKSRKSSKHSGARSAGRIAIGKMKIRGRGCAIEVHKNGKSFKARLQYVNKPGKNAELIYSNTDIQSMRACARMRPDIERPVAHVSISLPAKAGRLTKEEWESVVTTFREAYGLDETYPLQVWRHQDTDRDHIHCIFSRISASAQCHDAQNSKYRAAAIERIIEDRHKLILVPPSEFKSNNSKLTKAEVEQGLRTGQQPARLQIAVALEIALKDRPSVQQLAERLQAAEIGLRANVSKSTGKMNGFSFVFEGVEFKASQIERKYGWQSLKERIDGVENIDVEYLKQLDGTTGTASDELAQLTAITDQLTQSVARIGTSAPDAAGATGQPAPAVDRAIPRVEPTAPVRPVAPTPVAGRAPGRNAVVSNRVVAGRRAEPVDAVVPAHPPVIITPPDLRAERWSRSAQLLADYRRAIKSKVDIADLDRLASDAGHDPADIISAHATSMDKLPAEIAQKVLRNVPSTEMREYIQKEFATAKRRLSAQRLDEKVSDVDALAPRPR